MRIVNWLLVTSQMIYTALVVKAFGYAGDAIEWFLAMFAVVFRPDAERR